MRSIKKAIKKYVPQRLIDLRERRYIEKNHNEFNRYDKAIFLKHSNALPNGTHLKCIGIIIQLYHIIEKGLTMPNMKLGFGQQKLINLIDNCLEYQKKYDTSNIQYQHAVGVIAEYKKVHEDNTFALPANLDDKINSILKIESDTEATQQLHYSKDDYFKNKSAPFDEFSNSRHSVRNFSGEVKMSQIQQAIKLAQNTPTACNRQPIRVHIIENKQLIADAFKIQNGNRGFGHLVNKLIIITADLSCYQQSEERNLPYVDGGMYTMNLLYTLHFQEVAAIPLNWCRTVADDLQMRKLISLPDSEVIIVFIGCGDLPDEFKLALSKRNNYKDIYKIYN